MRRIGGLAGAAGRPTGAACVTLIAVIALGCSTSQTAIAPPSASTGPAAAASAGAAVACGSAGVQPVGHLQPADEPAGQGHVDQKASPVIDLPTAIDLCVRDNLRVLAERQQVAMAEADLTTSSLVPNPTLLGQYQLIPLQAANPANQLGPPQWDVQASIPIDWLLFGKRLAAVRAARLGVAVSESGAANALRAKLADTVDGFYEVLADEAYFKLAEANVAELEEIERVTAGLAKANKATDRDADRAKLAVHEAVLDRHDRELARDLAKARLRPLVGRTAEDPDFEVVGGLAVRGVVPPPTLREAVALAEAHRPDLQGGRQMIDQASAVLELERRRAKPQVAVLPGWSYQHQQAITGFRDGSLFDIGVTATLPLTDRNQGNIRKAAAAVRERQLTYQADRADLLAEVEASVATYADAVEHLTQFDTAETRTAAADLRANTLAVYRAGGCSLIEMLDAQRASQSRRAHGIEFEATYWRALNRLNAAVGLRPPDAGKAAPPAAGPNGGPGK